MSRPAVFGAFERLVAFRYLRARRQEGFVSVIAFFSLAGVAVGVATLIIVMSVMGGVEHEVLAKVLGFNGDLSAYSATGGGIGGFDSLVAKARAVPGVASVTPVVDGNALVSSARSAQGAQIRGERIEDLTGPHGIRPYIKEGSLDRLDDDSVVIGERLAFELGVGVGDEVTVTSPNGTATAFGTMPRVKTYRVAATFEFGMYQYDSAYIFTTLSAAQLFFRQAEHATQLEITLADGDDIAGPADKVADALGPEVRLIGWKRQVGGYLDMVETQRSVMFLILALIIVVAAFNVISSMIMLVKDKGRDIAILRTMGATQGMVLRIFFMAGGSVGTIGTVLGFALGVLVCKNIERIRELLQRLTGIDPFNAKMYFLDHIPARLDPMEVTEVVVMALGLSFLATIYPAWRAARLDPVEALRYE